MPSIAQNLHRNLPVARNRAAMTQHDLATAAGLSRATVAQLEAGQGDPRLSTLARLAKALRVSPLELLRREE